VPVPFPGSTQELFTQLNDGADSAVLKNAVTELPKLGF